MKKVFILTMIFLLTIILFIISNRQDNTEKVSSNFATNEDYYFVEFYNLKSTELINTFKNKSIDIIEIRINEYFDYTFTPSDSSIELLTSKLINNYKDYLIDKGYEDIAINAEVKGFNINSMLIRGLESDVKSLTNCKIIK